MKKPNLRVLALAAGILTMGGAFAQTPASNTNTVTSGLIEDEIVDQLDTGVEGKDFLFFGGYGLNTRQIQLGAGKFFGKGMWFSLYDGYFTDANTTEEESVKKDAVATDGVNIDYTDNSATANTSGSSRIKNDLAFSMYLFNKIGGTAYWNMDSTSYKGYAATDPTGALEDKYGSTTTNDDTENHADGTASDKTYTALENKKSTNTFGINFNGIRTPDLFGDLKFYVSLGSVQLTMEKRYINLAYSTKTSLNGSPVDGDDKKHPEYSGTYKYMTFTPSLSGELGMTLPKMWDCVTPEFTLGETFAMAFKSNSNTYNYAENTANNSTSLVRKTTDYNMNQGKYLGWKNTMTPKFVFDFDFTERLELKASVSTPFSLEGVSTGADSYTTKETIRTTTVATGEVTTTETVTTGGTARNTDTFTTTLTPSFAMGFVYKVVPEKFNINMGVTASTGSLTWKKTTTTNSNIPEVRTTTFTDAYGHTTTTSVVNTPTNGDGVGAGDATAESQQHNFTAATPSATARIGFTWFFGDKAQVDAFLISGSSAGSTNPLWAMNLTFGLRF